MTEVEFTNTSIHSTNYEWNFGDLSPSVFDEHPVHVFPDAAGGGTYTVILLASNDIGCYDTATAVITVDDVLIFYVPNVFTPDGNSINNEFTPIFSGGLDIYDYHLTIFNIGRVSLSNRSIVCLNRSFLTNAAYAFSVVFTEAWPRGC